MSYEEWVRAEAARINSDGCTGVSEWHFQCCLEHDLGCKYGKDTREAYKLAQSGVEDPWPWAPKITRRQVDLRFLDCNVAQSSTFFGKFRAYVRFLGVRLGAYLGIGVRR